MTCPPGRRRGDVTRVEGRGDGRSWVKLGPLPKEAMRSLANAPGGVKRKQNHKPGPAPFTIAITISIINTSKHLVYSTTDELTTESHTYIHAYLRHRSTGTHRTVGRPPDRQWSRHQRSCLMSSRYPPNLSPRTRSESLRPVQEQMENRPCPRPCSHPLLVRSYARLRLSRGSQGSLATSKMMRRQRTRSRGVVAVPLGPVAGVPCGGNGIAWRTS